jgi:uncharacterized SAM-binding protein YcdF (DUF218 family)
VYRLVVRLAVIGIIVTVLTSLAVSYAAHWANDRYGRVADGSAPARFALILGGGIKPDALPSFASRARIRRGIELLRAGAADTMLLSGGGRFGPEGKSAAALMRDFAIAEGAPADRILVEERAATTYENMIFSFAMIDDLGGAADGSDTFLVTSDTHLLRATLLAGYLGRDTVRPVSVDVLDRLTLRGKAITVQREASAWWYNLGRIAVWEMMEAVGLSSPAAGAPDR